MEVACLSPQALHEGIDEMYIKGIDSGNLEKHVGTSNGKIQRHTIKSCVILL